MRQTGCYAPKRAGRCSVFWGDQIFIPSAGHVESGAHHADILVGWCRLTLSNPRLKRLDLSARN